MIYTPPDMTLQRNPTLCCICSTEGGENENRVVLARPFELDPG